MIRTAGGASSLDQAVFFLHLGRARERLQAGRFEEARQELDLARLARPDDEDLSNLVSVVLLRQFPLCVSSRDLVPWTGDLLPSAVEDRFLDEIMMPDAANAHKLRFEGEGIVLTEAPGR